MKSRKAFTLIELLIVVAIIAILAAIAVPNFLEAQVRAKVSRAKSDIRSMATAIEAYAVDNNIPPREYDSDPAVDGPFLGQANASGIMSPVVSTPISYITNAFLFDPFVRQNESSVDPDQQAFTYANVVERKRYSEANGGAQVFYYGGPVSGLARCVAVEQNFGSWYMFSIGPDRRYDNNINPPPATSLVRHVYGSEYIVYDPTNGTISAGNIIKSQKLNFGEQTSDVNVLNPSH